VLFGESKQVVRPFQISAQVHCRGYSMPLQRLITDFGADIPFGQIPHKMQEHHGISVPISSAQKITQQHAQNILESQSLETKLREGENTEIVVTQIDGSMIPIVDTRDDEGDRRKTRTVRWMEAKLALSHALGEAPVFAVTLGTVEEAGAQLLHSAIRAGLGAETFIHGVGDGALWIAAQMKDIFGEPGRFLLDFYHVCEYLAEISHICSPNDAETWMEKQKARLKRNQYKAVLRDLELYLETADVSDKKAPVRAAYRYLYNRPEQLDYRNTIANELPIGSGEIESAHRYIIQSRLKRAGSWWTIEKAWAMLELRVLRANQDWSEYWMNLLSSVA
jgi:Uncharacterised protein family (UPF0236)